MLKIKNSPIGLTAIALLILVVVLSIASPHFSKLDNIINVFIQSSINATIAFGMTLVLLTGGIDLSVGSVLAFCGIIFGMLLKQEIPLIFSVLICILLAGFVGLLNGLLVTRLSLPPFIATLGMMTISRGFALYISNGRAISGFSGKLNIIGSGAVFSIPIMVIIVVMVFITISFVLNQTRSGRYFYAIGGNAEATRLSGINVQKYTTFAYIICGITSGIAAILLTSRLDSAQPVAGTGYEMNAIAASVIGGTSLSGGEGKLIGTLLGALIISILNNGLNLLNVSAYIQQIAIGIVIILAVSVEKLRKG